MSCINTKLSTAHFSFFQFPIRRLNFLVNFHSDSESNIDEEFNVMSNDIETEKRYREREREREAERQRKSFKNQ